jgi:hypothetical protein
MNVLHAAGLAVAVAALGACMTQPPQASRSAEAQAEFHKLTAGKVPGPAITCRPSYRSNDMVTIDDGTVAFKNGRTVYVNHLIGECNGLKSGFYTLVTRSSGSGLCRGDIARVADVSTGMVVGSCAVGDFIPYKTAG